MHAFADLPDDARVQVLPCDPPLTPEQSAALIAAIDKLFAQFAKEARLEGWAAEPAAGGALLVIASHGAEVLSGCSKDKLAQILAAHEQRTGCRLLDAPPIVVEVASTPRCVDRATLRTLVTQGAVSALTFVYDTRVDRLGDWRSRGRVPASDCWVGGLMG